MFDNSSVYSDHVLAFVKNASDFVEFADSIDSFSRKEFVDKALVLLPSLYISVGQLPHFEAIGETEKFCSQYDWDRVQHSVSKQLGAYESYFDLTEPLQFETGETVNLSTSETFADIFQSMSDFVSFYRITNDEGIQACLAEITADVAQYLGVRILRLAEELHLIRYGANGFTDDNESEHFNNFRDE